MNRLWVVCSCDLPADADAMRAIADRLFCQRLDLLFEYDE